MKALLTTIKQKLANRYAAAMVISLAVLTIPVAVSAWGPDRPTYTWANPADHVTFDSITDNPVYGDERNFMRVRPDDATSTYADNVNLVPGQKYEVMVYYHNNASTSLDASGVGVAHGVSTRAEIPAVVTKGATTAGEAFISASNATPQTVYDYTNFTNNSQGDMVLRYVPGSTTIHNFGATNGTVLPDTILGNGVTLGYNALDGTIPGCNTYSGYVTFDVTAGQAALSFTKQVRVHGTTTWSKNVAVKPGQQVDWELHYTNTGTTEQDNVVLKDSIPTGATYINGSTKTMNGLHPNGVSDSDSINAGGMNIGNYQPNSDAYLMFSTTINPTADCTTLTNTAAVDTDNGSATDSATATVNSGNCVKVAAASLPETGPGEVIVTLIGLAAITFGIVYYFRSRRDLQTALHAAQSHQVVTSKQAVAHHHAAHATTHHEHHKPSDIK